MLTSTAWGIFVTYRYYFQISISISLDCLFYIFVTSGLSRNEIKIGQGKNGMAVDG